MRLTVKNATAEVKQLGLFTWLWTVKFYEPRDPHRQEWSGYTFTLAGGWRRVGRVMAGTLSYKFRRR